jgi:hypothetical protein
MLGGWLVGRLVGRSVGVHKHAEQQQQEAKRDRQNAKELSELHRRVFSWSSNDAEVEREKADVLEDF